MARMFNNIMDFLQLIFAFINAPLFATFLLGMFWKRSTGHGAFFGLVSGTLAASIHHGITVPAGAETLVKGGWMGTVVHTYPSEMAQNFWTAIYAFTAALVLTYIISMATKQGCIDKGEYQLQEIHYIVEHAGHIGCPDAHENAEYRSQLCYPEIMPVGFTPVNVALVYVIGPHRIEGGNVPGHAGHERGHQRGESESQYPRREIIPEQHRDHLIVIVAVSLEWQVESCFRHSR
ncbi:hypothetical protein ES708_21345 [subsurface metagenome]